jgi:hypothetical protein
MDQLVTRYKTLLAHGAHMDPIPVTKCGDSDTGKVQYRSVEVFVWVFRPKSTWVSFCAVV